MDYWLGRITSTEADDAKAKFSELCASAKSKHKEQFDTFNGEQYLDVFYPKIFAGDEKQLLYHYAKLSKWY